MTVASPLSLYRVVIIAAKRKIFLFHPTVNSQRQLPWPLRLPQISSPTKSLTFYKRNLLFVNPIPLLFPSPMEDYARSHPVSGDGTPRVINFDNQSSSREEQPPAPAGCKAKFMISYGGRIQPRPHGNQLSYVGGQTKILTVDRNIEFSSLVSKLSVLCNAGVSFKYQLPGEDLDALISVTNDDDLEQMMHEYNRLHDSASGPPRLRLFLFPLSYSSQQSRFGSGLGLGNEVKADRYRFVDALSSGVLQQVGDSICQPPAQSPPAYNVDFLFGLDKGVGLPQPPPVIKVHDPIPDPDIHAGAPLTADDGIVMSDSLIDAPIQILKRLQISDQERQAMFRPKTDDSLVGLFPGDSYVKKLPEKTTPAATIPSTMAVHATYVSPEKNISDKGFTAMVGVEQQQQPMYVIPSPDGAYQSQIVQPANGQAGQGYYRVRRIASDVNREQPLFNMIPPISATPFPRTLPPQPPKMPSYMEGIGVQLRPVTGVFASNAGYAPPVPYDSKKGSQVYSTGPGGGVVTTPYQGAAASVVADVRSAGRLSGDGKTTTAKVPPNSAVESLLKYSEK